MSKGRWELPWFRVWTEFDSTEYWTSQIDNEELGAWTRLLRLANAQKTRGEIKIENNVPYSNEQLHVLLRGGEKYLDKWKNQGAIKIIKGIIFVINWEHWQGIRNGGHPGREKKVETKMKEQLKPTETKITVGTVKKQIPGFNAFAWFIDRYLVRRGQKYPAITQGKDAKLINEIYKKLGEDKFKEVIEAYHSSNDPFIKRKGFDVAALSTNIPGLLLAPAVRKPIFMPKDALEEK
jgi:hypothetical protein